MWRSLISVLIVLALAGPAAAFDLWGSATISGAESVRPLLAATIAYRDRVVADGGTVENIRMVDELFRDAAKNGYSSELIGWSARWGYKADSLGRVSKLYSLAGSTSDLVQSTVAQQPQLYTNSINGNNSVIFTGKYASGSLKTAAFTLNQPETLLFSNLNVVVYKTASTLYDGAVLGNMRLYMNPPGTHTLTVQGASIGPTTSLVTAGLKSPIRTVYNGASSSIKVGSNPTTTANAGAVNGGGFVIGSTPSGSGNPYLHVGDIIILTSAVNGSYAGKVAAAETILAKYSTSVEDAAPLLIFDGNSMTSGFGVAADYDYPSQVKRLFGNTVTWQNYGVPSRTLVTATTDATNITTGVDTSIGGVNKKTVVVVWDGTNDLYGGATGATTYNNLKTYLNARKATDPNVKLVVVTMLPRSNGGTPVGFEAERQTFNTLVRADGDGIGYTVADVAADSRIGDAGDEADTTYYLDRVHMTAVGYEIVAGMVKDAIVALL